MATEFLDLIPHNIYRHMHLSFLGKETTEAAEATVGLGGGDSRLGGRLGLGDSVDLVEEIGRAHV